MMMQGSSLLTALSSTDGVQWYGPEGRLQALDLTQPFTNVRRLVLGDLQSGVQLPASAELKDVLRNVAAAFPGLTDLHLWHVSELADVGGLPSTLQCLDLRGCRDLQRIEALPATARLQTLDLADCSSLVALPEADVSSLTRVWLHGCARLAAFRPLRDAVQHLQHLELHDCRFMDLSTDLCGQTGENVAAKVRQHFNALEQGKLPLAECKLIVLGDGGVGKTSLVRALLGLPHDTHQTRTHGICLWRWDGVTNGRPPELFPEYPDVKLHLNIWDFGGQDLYHNTHRLFMETQAVFIIVEQDEIPGMPRREEVPDDLIRPLQYWLDKVWAATAGSQHAPFVLLVRTGIDRTDTRIRKLPPWKSRVDKKFHELPYFELSCCDQQRSTAAWNDFRRTLLNQVCRALGGAEAVLQPVGRVRVREKLRGMQPVRDEQRGRDEQPVCGKERPLLLRHDFDTLVRETFQEANLPAPDNEELRWQLDFFHHRGVVYAPGSWLGQDLTPGDSPIFVDQGWLISGIYALLADQSCCKKWFAWRGEVSRAELLQAWDSLQAQKPTLKYDDEARGAMLACMEHFGLLVPTECEFEWTGILPEFLPERYTVLKPTLLNVSSEVKQWSQQEKRGYRLQHFSLGLNAGCQLIGWLVRTFGSRSLLYRFGAFVTLRIDGVGSAESVNVPLEVQWKKESENDFFGAIWLWIPDHCKATLEVLGYIEEELRNRSIVPGNVQFQPVESTSGDVNQGLPGQYQPLTQEMLPYQSRVRPVLTLGRVGISMAGGSDDDDDDLEYWPALLDTMLTEQSGGKFKVNRYRRDRDMAPTVHELTADLASRELLIAVISDKYLKSKYCMVELLMTARKWSIARNEDHRNSPDFLGAPGEWLPRIVFMTLEGDILQWDDQAILNWSGQWFQAGRAYVNTLVDEYRDEKVARVRGTESKVHYPWMEFVSKGHTQAKRILDAMINGDRYVIPSLKDCPAGISRDEWARQTLSSLIKALRPKIDRFLAEWTSGEKIGRCVQLAVRYYREGRAAEASRYVDYALQEFPDSQTVTRALQDGLGIPEELADLNELLPSWRERQGIPAAGRSQQANS